MQRAKQHKNCPDQQRNYKYTWNLNKINNWEHIKGKSLWVNVNFDEPKQINNIDHLSFSFKTLSLNDMLGFSINLIDDDNRPIQFNSG